MSLVRQGRLVLAQRCGLPALSPGGPGRPNCPRFHPWDGPARPSGREPIRRGRPRLFRLAGSRAAVGIPGIAPEGGARFAPRRVREMVLSESGSRAAFLQGPRPTVAGAGSAPRAWKTALWRARASPGSTADRRRRAAAEPRPRELACGVCGAQSQARGAGAGAELMPGMPATGPWIRASRRQPDTFSGGLKAVQGSVPRFSLAADGAGLRQLQLLRRGTHSGQRPPSRMSCSSRRNPGGASRSTSGTHPSTSKTR